MNFDAVISWLLRCDWFFLAGWTAALAGATATVFGQAPVSIACWKNGPLQHPKLWKSGSQSRVNPPK